MAENNNLIWLNEEKNKFTTPWWVIFDVKQQPSVEPELSTEDKFKDALQDEPVAKTATKQESVVDRWTTDEEVPTLDLNRETFTDIQAKSLAWQKLTEEEKLLAGRVKARRDLWESIESIFWEEQKKADTLLSSEDADILAEENLRRTSADITNRLKAQWLSDIQIQQVLDRRRIAREEVWARVEAQKQKAEAQTLSAQKVARETDAIKRRTRALQNQTQRLRSLRGVGRSTATEWEILELERQGQDLIDTAERKAQLELDLQNARIEWAEADVISSLKENLTNAETALQEKLNANIENQKLIDAELNADFDTSVNNMLGILEASWQDIWDFDEKATKALGYISDEKWRPLVLDSQWNPVAPKNEFGMDAKITNFKDGNDNTYVYTNWELTSIITNDGQIIKGDRLNTVKVPAQIKEDKKRKEIIDRTTNLRKEFNNLPEIKEFKAVQSAFSKVNQSAKAVSPAWDMAMIFNFMKMLDPGSVVRESEFASAANAAPLLEKLWISFDKISAVWDWKILTPKQRLDFLTRAEDLLEWQEEIIAGTQEFYGSIADKIWVNADEVFEEVDLWQWFEFDEEDEWQLDSIFLPTETITTETSASFKSGDREFNIDLWELQDFNIGDQTSWTKVWVSNIGLWTVTQNFWDTSPLTIDNVKLADWSVWTPWIDIDGKIGDTIPSPISWTVKKITKSNTWLWNSIVVEDEQWNEHFFNHLSQHKVKEWMPIRKWQVFASIWNSWSVIKWPGGDGSHLDYRVRSSKWWIDPNQFLNS
jgi:hypothetical protein